MTSPPEPTTPLPATDAPHSRRAWNALALLVAVNVFSQVDRQLLTLLVEPVKAEFDFSASQRGLLTGTAFALCESSSAPVPKFVLGGERVRPQAGGYYAGWVTDAIVGPFKGDPGSGHW